MFVQPQASTPQRAEPAIVRLDQVSVRFGAGPTAYEAVRGATLDVAAGEFVAIAWFPLLTRVR